MNLTQLLASLKSLQPAEAERIGKLHAWLSDGSRVFFVWDGARYVVRAE